MRGTAFDPLGCTEEREWERALIAEYRACVEELLSGLSAQRLAQAAARAKWERLVSAWRSGHGVRRAA